MLFKTPHNEQIFVAEILPERSYMFNQDLKTGLTIVWNRGKTANFKIDGKSMSLKQNCMIFLTEFHRIEEFEFEKMNVIQFNRPFYCVEKDDTEVGCRGILFFGAADLPKIVINAENLSKFMLLWEVFLMEMEEHDDLKLTMLRTMLKRFLVLCLRLYRREGKALPTDNVSVGIIREFNYLVEQYFRKHTTVAEYAELLNKSPKTLSNIFKKYIDHSPLQIIQNRRALEARRLLQTKEKPIKEIAYELGFSDIQTFSHFFKKQEGSSPTQFREK